MSTFGARSRTAIAVVGLVTVLIGGITLTGRANLGALSEVGLRPVLDAPEALEAAAFGEVRVLAEAPGGVPAAAQPAGEVATTEPASPGVPVAEGDVQEPVAPVRREATEVSDRTPLGPAAPVEAVVVAADAPRVTVPVQPPTGVAVVGATLGAAAAAVVDPTETIPPASEAPSDVVVGAAGGAAAAPVAPVDPVAEPTAPESAPEPASDPLDPSEGDGLPVDAAAPEGDDVSRLAEDVPSGVAEVEASPVAEGAAPASAEEAPGEQAPEAPTVSEQVEESAEATVIVEPEVSVEGPVLMEPGVPVTVEPEVPVVEAPQAEADDQTAGPRADELDEDSAGAAG